jgi:hypothetical protein
MISSISPCTRVQRKKKKGESLACGFLYENEGDDDEKLKQDKNTNL